jgi:iron complex outermembrane receptor protein
VVNIDASYGNWWGGEVKLVTTAFNRQKIVTGIEYEYDQREHIENYDENPHAIYEEHNRTGRRVGVYAQDDITLLQNLILSTGLRIDQNHMIKHEQINPRLGLIWHPRSDTTMKLLYGSAFRAPNVNERDVFTTPNNSEEHIKTYEFASEWEPGTGLKLSGSVFYTKYTDVLQIDPVTELSVNAGTFISHGYELGAEKRWTDGRSAKASFEHVILFDESAGDTMWAENSPKNVGKLQCAQPLWNEKAKLGIENVYVSRRRTAQNTMAAAYDLVNLNLTSNRIMTGLDAALGVYNVFDTHAEMVAGSDFLQDVIPMNGRSIQLRLQFTF